MPRDGLAAFQVSAVPPSQVDLVWPQVLPMVERGLRHAAGNTTTAEHVRAAIMRGSNLLWAVHEGDDILAAIVLAVTRHPASTALTVVLIAGRDFKRWAPTVQALLEDYRALIGADSLEAVVRDGMTRWLGKLGWKRQATIMRLED